MPRKTEIRRYVKAVAERFRPQKVVLFGSSTTAQPPRGSDVDLLVVMPHRGPAALQAARIRQEVPAGFALDLMVRSPEKIKERLALGDSFLRDVFRDGEVLYESAG
jgi:predicted nucleotidyltransferase